MGPLLFEMSGGKGHFPLRREKFEEYDDGIFTKIYHFNIINLENGLL
jgi:hypothetical protein